MYIYEKEYFYKTILKSDEVTVHDILRKKRVFYKEYKIPKANGTRTIYAIELDSGLYKLQKNLKNNALDKFVLPIPVKGFIKNENYVTYLSEHIARRFYLRMDIKSFFDNITVQQIQEALSSITNDKDIIKDIIDIVTLERNLPQGAVTSPTVSNIIFSRIDQRILKYCQEVGVYYTRYADDMLFSSDRLNFRKGQYFYSMIKNILKANGFDSNYHKKKTGASQINLSGFVVGDDIHLSRKKLKKINTILYYFRNTKDFTNKQYAINHNIFKDSLWLEKVNALIGLNKNDNGFLNPSCFINYLCGYRAFLISIIKNNSLNECKQYRCLSNKVKNIEKLVNAITQYSNEH